MSATHMGMTSPGYQVHLLRWVGSRRSGARSNRVVGTSLSSLTPNETPGGFESLRGAGSSSRGGCSLGDGDLFTRHGGGGIVRPLADDIERPALGLVVEAADVLAEDAERDQLHAAKEQDRYQRSGLPGELRVTCHAQGNDDGNGENGQACGQEAEERSDLERKVREAGDGV